jgi:hypothetical protein
MRVLALTGAISLACSLAALAPGWHALHVNLNPGSSRCVPAASGWQGAAIAQLSISMVHCGRDTVRRQPPKLYRVDPVCGKTASDVQRSIASSIRRRVAGSCRALLDWLRARRA